MTAEEVKAQHPEAIEVARSFREVFGDGVKLTYAENLVTGAKLGQPIQGS